jgi:ectoine hydroxylase-related dioxygenase (phytanoyl-CoA dioxygenase family)
MAEIYKYPTTIYDFRSQISEILEAKNLENLHTQRSYEVFTQKTDQSTEWHRKFYDNFSVMNDLYLSFIRDFIKPLFNEKIVYQKVPTFRVHLVGNLSVGEFHRDRDYRHLTSEINFWIPFTNAYDTNTIWIESEEGLNDVSPHKVNYGEVLRFDGANLLHGNQINSTDATRVSMDFRIIPYSIFVPSSNSSVFTNRKFDIGGYFELME